MLEQKTASIKDPLGRTATKIEIANRARVEIKGPEA